MPVHQEVNRHETTIWPKVMPQHEHPETHTRLSLKNPPSPLGGRLQLLRQQLIAVLTLPGKTNKPLLPFLQNPTLVTCELD
jgi:hypothetical protein